MNIESVKSAYFSPTGTTKAVVQGITAGMNPINMQLIDVTTPDARKEPLETAESEVLVVGVPVYMGRVPALLHEWLHAVQAHDTPTVCVVVYGNRAYDDALLELKDIVSKRGCIPIAAAAFIGEHSFSSTDSPTAQGRPDKNDLKDAEVFGRNIRQKLQAASAISAASEVVVPGTYPYGGITDLWNVDFIEVGDNCTQCGICAELCPAGAVDRQHSEVIDQEKCITCCACIKRCPEQARRMKPGAVQDAQTRLSSRCKEPKKPEYFL